MNMGNRDISILQKIVKHCDDIADAITQFGNTFESLEANVHYKNAVSMCVLQIGELAGHLSEDFRASHREIPWQAIKGMRNIAAHEYENFDMITLWNTISRDIPALRGYCLQIINQYTAPESEAKPE